MSSFNSNHYNGWNFFLPEVVKRGGVDLLPQHISDGGIRHDISMQESQTQSQQPGTQQRVLTRFPAALRIQSLLEYKDVTPKSRSDGGDVGVQAASGSSDIQRQRPLEDGGEDLHLVGTAVLGDLEPLNQELDGDDKQELIKLDL